MENSKLIYTTENGGICCECGYPAKACKCDKLTDLFRNDGIVRIRREIKGRAGKTVTTIAGIPLNGRALEDMVSELKRRCSAGGSVKEGVIIVQGDHRKILAALLETKGYKVKLAGG